MNKNEWTELDTAVARVAALKAQAKQIADDLLEAEMATVDLFHQHGVDSWVDAETGVKGTLVEPVRIVIPEEKLKKAIGAAKWKIVTKSVLDKKLLEANIVNGNIDPNVVASVSEENPTKPYIKCGEPDPVAAARQQTTRKNLGTKKKAAPRGGPKKVGRSRA